ncbi:MAG: YhdP family protein, partial [Rhodocyclaceae bacterium]|nr:YhdP family protein [Rhodocyclaceae bacterium]
IWFVIAATILLLRYAVLPNVESWRGDIEQTLTQAIRLPVTIRALEARWSGLIPGVTLRGVDIHDAQNRVALSFEHVDADLSWDSLWVRAPRLSRLEIFSPTLDIRRNEAGRFFVAGLEINPNDPDAGFAEWLFAQNRITVRRASVTWNDEMRGSPPLTLTDLDIDLYNRGTQHRFGLIATPPRALAARMEFRGEFQGHAIDSAKGTLYAELDQANISAWQPWVDLPSLARTGRGGVRLRLGFAEGKLQEVASGFRLADVSVAWGGDPFTLSHLHGGGSGQQLPTGEWRIHLHRIAFQNEEVEGTLGGDWQGMWGDAGKIDLSGEISRAEGGAVWRYLPHNINADTREWLRKSIEGGQAKVTLRLSGELDKFPFRDGSGVFEIKGPFSGVTLRYAPDWPAFEKVSGELSFMGEKMTIHAKQANLWGVVFSDITAIIPDLEAPEEIITIDGTAKGPVTDFLRFIEASPVGDRIDHFTEEMTAEGVGDLALKLVMNLRHINQAAVTGRYRFQRNHLRLDPAFPPLTDVEGTLQFTTDRVETKDIRAMFSGAPVKIEAKTDKEGVQVRASGLLSLADLRRDSQHPAFDHLSGTFPWRGTIKVRKKTAEMRFESSLTGLSSSLPPPFNKSTMEEMPLVFERKPSGALTHSSLSLGSGFRAQWLTRGESVERGAVVINTVGVAALPRLPGRETKEIKLMVRAGTLDTDAWRRLLGVPDAGASSFPSIRAELRADELIALGRVFHGLRWSGTGEAGRWAGDIASQEATGTFEWQSEGAGRLTAQLSRLAISKEENTAQTPPSTQGMPDVHLKAKHFLLHGRNFGELNLDAENREGAWNVKFNVANEQGKLTATGLWRPGTENAGTWLGFNLSVGNIEKLLTRLEYPDTVRRGTADLAGAVWWNGPPTTIDYPTLSGNITLKAENGQFSKLEPGAGRLLGLLSMQSLPRRLFLDFRDVFSEGFSFDHINGRLTLAQGLMETSDLSMQGPAARVFVTGSANIAHETQHLKVRIQPAIGETLATGVLLANPAAAAVLWLADKILKDPLGQAFAFEYAVTGSWADPKVEKIVSQPASPSNLTEEKQ